MAHPIPILLYHRIDRSGLSTATTVQDFHRQLQWLHERGWRTLSAQELTRCLEMRRPAPPRSFVITFDDGYESLASAALPVLRMFGYSAICFLSTHLIRGTRDAEAIPPAGEAHGELFLSWDQVRALQSQGSLAFHSHTHSHARFDEDDIDALTVDLEISLSILTHELRLPRRSFEHLAWPWGRSTPAWRALAQRMGFRYQYTVARQSLQPHTPLDAIPRTCFDATRFSHFQHQFRLQAGMLAGLWNLAYPCGRRLRRLASFS